MSDTRRRARELVELTAAERDQVKAFITGVRQDDVCQQLNIGRQILDEMRSLGGRVNPDVRDRVLQAITLRRAS